MMFEGTTFGRNVDLLHRTMDVSLMRQAVIANNIANVNTPNFKRTSVNFETQLKHALSGGQPPRLQAALTNEKHIPFFRAPDYREVMPRRMLDYTTTAKNNGNNVDIEVESMDLLNNQLAYQMMARSVTDVFQRVNLVLR